MEEYEDMEESDEPCDSCGSTENVWVAKTDENICSDCFESEFL